MKENRTDEGRFTQNGRGLGTVTEEMVRARARELALINGRPEQVLDSDLDQARRELQGEERLNPEPTPAEEVPEEERWQVVADNSGQKAPTVPASPGCATPSATGTRSRSSPPPQCRSACGRPAPGGFTLPSGHRAPSSST